MTTGRLASVAGFKEVGEIDSGDDQGWKDAGRDTGEQGNGYGEDQHVRIERSFAEAWNVAWIEKRQGSQKENSEANSDGSGTEAEEQRLCE